MTKDGASGRPAPEDLTARARIRDAAMEQFADRGFKGTTIRSVAEAAGVSPGLVQHHFGTKEALRQACDTYAIEAAMAVKEKMINEDGMNDPGLFGMALGVSTQVQRYISRAMAESSPGAVGLFDDLVAYTEATLSNSGMKGVSAPDTSDLHAYAATMVAMQVGVMVLRDHLSRALGADILTPEGYPRLALALVEIYGDRLVDREFVEMVRAQMRPLLAPSTSSADTKENADD